MGQSMTISTDNVRIRGLVAFTALFSLFSNLLMLTGPLFMLQVYDRVLGSRSEETLVALFALVTLLYTFHWVIEYSRARVMARAGARIQAGLAAPVFRAMLERAALRQAGGGQRARGGLVDLEALRALFSAPVVLALYDMPWTPFFLAAIFFFHPLLGSLAAAGGAVLIVVAVLNQVLTARGTAEGARRAGQAQLVARQAEESAGYLWAQGMVPVLVSRWRGAQDEAVSAAISATDWSGSFTSFSKAFRLFLQSAMLALGAWLVLQQEVTAGAMIASSIMLGRALQPIEIAVSQWTLVQRAWTGRAAIRALLKDLPDRAPPTELPVPSATLDLSGVTVLARRGAPPVLRQVTMALRPGEAIGVIGRSGSGKTTLARVITGLVAPAAGEVRLAGATPEQYGPERLGRFVGYLPQEIRFFDGTIAENVARMDPIPDAAKVVAAAKLARVHDIVLKLPEGYDTRIGAADAQLSGGQRHRLALARALYGGPVLLILDEPNSALDAEGSDALNAVILAMKEEGNGVLVMTHRPTAIAACDKLLVLRDGTVAAFGPRDEIIRKMMKNAGDVQRVVAGGKSS